MSSQVPATPLLGFVLLALGNMSFFLTAFKMTVLLPAAHKNSAAALLSTLGDASCVVFLGFNAVSEAWGLALWQISLGYADRRRISYRNRHISFS